MTSGGARFTADEVAELFGDLDRPVAIAVSGGVDSIALMHLVAQWRADGGGVDHAPPLVLTVDHGLRAESAGEAAFVADVARGLGFAHEVLGWTGPKPAAGIQDAARRARYDLMLTRLTDDLLRRDLLLAHHMEDQAETLLMRLARGSGIDGLSAMRPVEHRVVPRLAHPVTEATITLRRPLLGLSKARLTAAMSAIGAAWRDDPSNADLRFERVRLRRAAGMLDGLGLSPVSLARSARRLARERAAAIDRCAGLVAGRFDAHDGACGVLRLPLVPPWPIADTSRILSRIMAVYGGAAAPAQLSQIETLAERIAGGGTIERARSTLGGCIVEIADVGSERTVGIMREPDREALPAVTLQPGEGIFWDRRFYISVAPEAQQPYRIAAFAPVAGDEIGRGLPRRSVTSLPALVGDDGQICLWPRSTHPLIDCRFAEQHRATLAFAGSTSDETI